MKITEKTALKWARSQLEKHYGVGFSWLGRGKSNFKEAFDEYFGPEWECIMGRLVPDACFLLTKGEAACMGIIEAEWSAPMSRDKLKRYYEMWDYLVDFSYDIKKTRDVLIYTVGNGFNLELRNPCDFFPAILSAESLLKPNA
jgi:hypothetical protein